MIPWVFDGARWSVLIISSEVVRGIAGAFRCVTCLLFLASNEHKRKLNNVLERLVEN